jgi:hypothetical protein
MVVKTHRAHGLPVTALLLVTLLVVSAHAVHELTRARVLSPLLQVVWSTWVAASLRWARSRSLSRPTSASWRYDPTLKYDVKVANRTKRLMSAVILTLCSRTHNGTSAITSTSSSTRVLSYGRGGRVQGGTGITPVLQVIAAVLADPKDTTQLSLIYANQSEDDILVRRYCVRRVPSVTQRLLGVTQRSVNQDAKSCRDNPSEPSAPLDALHASGC